jgi:decaprenyl-phosphate phosphoribosyltransferase
MTYKISRPPQRTWAKRTFPSLKGISIADIKPYVTALRPHHWSKNLIVFAAPLFDFNFSLEATVNSVAAFCFFCAVSSSFYLFNDIVDVESDRRHPVKCNRPIAAGLVPVSVATGMALSLLGGSIIWGLHWSLPLGLTLISYAVLQLAYNLKLKRVVLLDILVIASGFVLRALAGAVATGVALSVWFLVCTAMLALFLAIEKRKAELRHSGGTRAVLKRYSPSLLLRLENSATTGTLMSYALWSTGIPIHATTTTPWMMLTFPFVLYGIFRYQLLSDPQESRQMDGAWMASEITFQERASKERTERPEDVLLSDMPLLLTLVAWGVTAFTIMWLDHHGLIA